MSLEGGNLNDKSYKMLKSDNVSKQDKQQIRKALASKQQIQRSSPCISFFLYLFSFICPSSTVFPSSYLHSCWLLKCIYKSVYIKFP